MGALLMYERQALLLLPLVRPLPARLPLPPLRVRGFLGLALAPKLKLIPLAICAALVVVGEAASITASPPERRKNPVSCNFRVRLLRLRVQSGLAPNGRTVPTFRLLGSSLTFPRRPSSATWLRSRRCRRRPRRSRNNGFRWFARSCYTMLCKVICVVKY